VRERGEVVPGDVQPFDEREVLGLSRVARREAQLGDPALDPRDGGGAQLDPIRAIWFGSVSATSRRDSSSVSSIDVESRPTSCDVASESS
jgi:hypothetical protein